MLREHEPGNFIDRKDFYATLGKAQDWLDQDFSQLTEQNRTQALQAYSQLIELRDQAFPLLLRNGNSFNLPRDPVGVYPLPPIEYLSQNQRWLLAQYPGTANIAPRIAILEWQTPAHDNDDAEITKIAEHDIQSNEDNTPERQRQIKYDLAERPLQISVIPAGNLTVIQLQYRTGQVHIMASTSGIESIHWSAHQPPHPNRRSKRISIGAMPSILNIQENADPSNWFNDSLYDKDHQSITISEPNLGTIHAVDGCNEAATRIYCGGDKGRVFLIEDGELSHRHCSPYLGSSIHDIQMVPNFDDDSAQASHCTVLVAMDNGYIHCLQDNAEGRLFVAYFQNVGVHIVQLFGFGARHLLALDHQSNLIPLWLCQPKTFQSCRHKLMYKLHTAFKLLNHEQHKKQLCEIQNPSQAKQLARLSLEYFIAYSRQDDYDPAPLSEWCLWLNREYKPNLENNDYWIWLDLHLSLIRRLGDWLHMICSIALLSENKLQLASDHRNLCNLPDEPDKLEPLWRLFAPAWQDEKEKTLLPPLPDEVLLRLLRDYDWLRRCLDQLDKFNDPDYKPYWDRVLHSIAEARKRLLPGLTQLRPISILGTSRWQRPIVQCHCIHREDEDEWAILLDDAHTVHLLHVPAKDPDKIWEFYKVKLNLKPEDGQPVFLLAGPELDDLFARLTARSQTDTQHWCFIATDRGVLIIYDWQPNRQLRERSRIKRPLYVRFAANYHPYGQEKRLFLAGYNHQRHGIIATLKPQFNGSTLSLQYDLWWLDAERSDVHKLFIAAPAKSDGQYQLWATNNRRRGALLRWKLPARLPTSINNPCDLMPLLSDQHFNCLIGAPVPELHLLCGGQNGLTYAVDVSSGTIRWLASSGSSLRKLAWLESSDTKKPIWVLGDDHPHAILLNSTGELLGACEDIGPVTAFCKLSNTRILIANQEGRIALLDSKPDYKSPSTNAVNKALPSCLHPISFYNQIKDSELFRLFKHLANRSSHCEYMVARAWLKHAADSLITEDSEILLDEQPGGSPFLNFLLRQDAHRIALFLADLRRSKNPNLTQILTRLVPELWQAFPQQNPDTLILQLLSYLLSLLERGLADQPTILTQINQHLWDLKINNDGGFKNATLQDLKLNRLFRRQRVQGLQLAQAIRLWQQTAPDKPAAERLNDWCQALWQCWNQPSVPVLGQRLNQLPLAEFRLTREKGSRTTVSPLLLSEQDWRWQYWLWTSAGTINSVGYDTTLVDENVPEALQPLSGAQLQPWTTKQKDLLRSLWPGRFWSEWIQRVYNLLNDYTQFSDSEHPVIWRQIACLNQLRGQFLDQGSLWFTPSNGYALLALWWPHLSQQWRKAVAETIEKKLTQTVTDPARYVDITVRKTRWLSAQQVVFDISITNRHFDELILQEASSNEFTGIQTHGSDNTGLPLAIPKADTELAVTVNTSTVDTACGQLAFELASHSTSEFFPVTSDVIDERRSLHGFHDSPGFATTWERLDIALRDAEQQNTDLLWWDGDTWSSEERQRLKVLISDQFGVSVDEYRFDPANIETIVWEGTVLVSPDIALGQTSPETLLEQVYGLLKNHGEETNRLALSIWVHYHPATTTVIRNALEKLLFPRKCLDNLLNTLLGSTRLEAFQKTLALLPNRAVGAWCRGYPIFVQPNFRNDYAINDLYPPAASLLDLTIWQCLVQSGLDLAKCSVWLDQSPEATLYQSNVIPALTKLSQSTSLTLQESNIIAGQLFRALTENPDDAQSITPIDTDHHGCVYETSLDPAISVLHGEAQYPRCRIAIINHSSLSKLAVFAGDDTLLLLIGITATPSRLVGTTVILSPSDLVKVMFAETITKARDHLNEIASLQLALQGDQVFRTAAGMSPLGIARHFAGRKTALEQLQNAVKEADQGTIGTRLVIGTRRIGKTSLVQAFRDRLKTNHPTQHPVYLEFSNFEFSYEQEWSDSRYTREFLKTYFYKASFTEKPYENFLRSDWPSDRADNQQQQNEAVQKLKGRLQVLKGTGGAPVLILDETLPLFRIDAGRNFPILRFLRELVTTGQMVLIITSYPFHPSEKYAVYWLSKNSESFLYNFFGQVIFLNTWEEKTAWDYLHDKLAGFGITLPLNYRVEMQQLSRCIPWLIHQLGLSLVERLSRTHSRLVLREDWAYACKQAIIELRNEFRPTVNDIAEAIDRTAELSTHSYANESLAGGNLWHALCRLAYPQPLDHIPDQEIEFTLGDIGQILKSIPETRIQAALNRLTATSILHFPRNASGDDAPYAFANNLLPAFLHFDGDSDI